MKINTKLWIVILLLALLSPLGLILPAYFKAGSGGFEKKAGYWPAPLSDYAFKHWQNKGLAYLGFTYLISAFIGVMVIFMVILVIGKKLTKKND